MGSAGQLARSSRRRGPSFRRDGQQLSAASAWAVLVATILSRSVLSTIVALLLWSVLPNLVGFQTTTVMSGSMAPRLQVGDAIVVRHVEASGLAVGQVLLFDDPDQPGRLRMHRLVKVRADGRLVTRGDANRDDDSSTIELGAVRGAAFLRIPYAGLPNYWIRTGRPLPVVGSGLLVLVLLGGVRLGRLLEDGEERARRRHRGVRRPALHRATAASVILLVLSSGALEPEAAHAAYSGRTGPPASSWATMCGDVVPTNLGTNPLLYWGYGSGTGRDVTDLSGNGDTGTAPTQSDATSLTCAGGSSPSVQVGASGKGLVVEKSLHQFPNTVTVATWFRTSTAGGTLADFGNSSSVVTPSAANTVDRVLYMRSDGRLSFGVEVLSLVNLGLSTVVCTSSGTYADSSWHLAVATYSDATGCTLNIDADPVAVASAGIQLKALTGYSGYWRFGYDAVTSSGWAGAVNGQPQFQGQLDESQVYAAVLDSSARAAILNRGH